MTMPATLPFKTTRMLGRIGIVIIYQVLALILGVTGAAAAMSATASANIGDASKSVGGFLLAFGFVVLIELILIIRVSVLARLAFRSGQRDAALGWLIGLFTVLGIPFLLFVLALATALVPH